MKFFKSVMLSGIAASALFGGTVSVPTSGWNLLGAVESINPSSTFNVSTVKSVWEWNATTQKWIAYAPSTSTSYAGINTLKTNNSIALFGTSDLISIGSGYWINTTSANNIYTINSSSSSASSTSAVSPIFSTTAPAQKNLTNLTSFYMQDTNSFADKEFGKMSIVGQTMNSTDYRVNNCVLSSDTSTSTIMSNPTPTATTMSISDIDGQVGSVVVGETKEITGVKYNASNATMTLTQIGVPAGTSIYATAGTYTVTTQATAPKWEAENWTPMYNNIAITDINTYLTQAIAQNWWFGAEQGSPKVAMLMGTSTATTGNVVEGNSPVKQCQTGSTTNCWYNYTKTTTVIGTWSLANGILTITPNENLTDSYGYFKNEIQYAKFVGNVFYRGWLEKLGTVYNFYMYTTNNASIQDTVLDQFFKTGAKQTTGCSVLQ